MKRFFKKFKNAVLWTVFGFNMISFILCVCCLDSDFYVLFGSIALLNFAYMALFYFVNKQKIDGYIERHAD